MEGDTEVLGGGGGGVVVRKRGETEIWGGGRERERSHPGQPSTIF